MFVELWKEYMSKNKNKSLEPMIDADTIYIEPGIYKPVVDMYVPHNNHISSEEDMWKRNEHFIVSKHVEKIGLQQPYQYYAIKKLGPSKHFLIKSYETNRWNVIAYMLERTGLGFN